MSILPIACRWRFVCHFYVNDHSSYLFCVLHVWFLYDMYWSVLLWSDSSEKLKDSTMEKAFAALTEVVGFVLEFLEDAQVGSS